MNVALSSIQQRALAASLLCFLTLTNKITLSKMIVSIRNITAVQSTDHTCGNSVSIELKDGKKLCVIDSFMRIEKALEDSRDCSASSTL